MSSMGSAEAVLGASAASLASVPGIGRDLAVQIATADYGKAVDEQFSWAEKAGAGIVTLGDPNYPFLLRQIHDPPVFLWMRGRLPVSDAPGTCAGCCGYAAYVTVWLARYGRVDGGARSRGIFYCQWSSVRCRCGGAPGSPGYRRLHNCCAWVRH